MSSEANEQALQHPAADAWARHTGSAQVCVTVETLKEKRRSAVYLLRGQGVGGTDIVAKVATAGRISAEVAMYEALSRAQGLNAPCYLGQEGSEGGRTWMFVEAVAGRSFDGTDPTHRALAGRWLGSLHSDFRLAAPPDGLPVLHSAHFRLRLDSARRKLEVGLANPAAEEDDVALIRTLLDLVSVVEANWAVIEEVSCSLLFTLIHNDFSPKNMVVAESFGVPRLRVYDWGSAGWGSPVADLAGFDRRDPYWANPDLQEYRRSVATDGGRITVEHLRTCARVGVIVRSISTVDGDAGALERSWIRKAIGKLEVYAGQLAEVLGLLRMTRGSSGSAPRGLE